MIADPMTLAAVVASDPAVQAARDAATAADEAFAAALDEPAFLRLTDRPRIDRLHDAARLASQVAATTYARCCRHVAAQSEA